MLQPGRKYKARTAIAVSGSAGALCFIGVQCVDANGAPVGGNAGLHYNIASNVTYAPDSLWKDLESADFDLESLRALKGGSVAGVRLISLLNYSAPSGTTTRVHLDGLWLEDITEATARAEIVQSAVADIQSGLASSITMRTKAGTSGAQLELVAASNPSGAPVSAARISAGNILLNGTVTASQLIQSQALITNKAQIKSLLLDESLIAPNAISRMVHTVRATVVAPGTRLNKWVYQAPPGRIIRSGMSSITVPADIRSMYADYLTAAISAPYPYDLYFWVMLNGGDVVGTLYRNSDTTPYSGAAYRSVLDSHTSYSYNSGSMVGVVPNVTGTQKLTLSFAGIHGSNWTEVSNCAITLMALMK